MSESETVHTQSAHHVYLGSIFRSADLVLDHQYAFRCILGHNPVAYRTAPRLTQYGAQRSHKAVLT